MSIWIIVFKYTKYQRPIPTKTLTNNTS